MFIASKRNILLPSSDGSQVYPVRKGFVGEVPEWASSTSYFEALVRDGKISVPENKKDKTIDDAVSKPISSRKPRKKDVDAE